MEIIELYHGTNEWFTEFDREKLSTKDSIDQYGSGFYFYDSPSLTMRHGEFVVYADCTIEKILDADKSHKMSMSFHQAEELLLVSPDLDDVLTNFGDIDYESWDHVFYRAVETYYKQDVIEMLNAIGNDFFKGKDTYILLKKFKEITGYNCIRKSFDDYSIYVMLDKNDINITKVISNSELE